MGTGCVHRLQRKGVVCRGAYSGCARCAAHTLWNWTSRDIFQTKSQKSYKDNCVLSSPNVCAICMYVGYSTALVFEETFAQVAFAIVSCAVSGLNEFYTLVSSIWQTLLPSKPGCATFQSHTCRARKLVIDKILTRNRSLFLQLWPALFQGWVYFTALLFWSCDSGCALFEAHTLWARLLVFKDTFVQTVFAVLNGAVVGLSVFYSLVSTCRLIFLQFWLLGRGVECILHLHFKLERW